MRRRKMSVNTGSVGTNNADTAEKDLMTFTIPAKVIDNNERGVFIRAYGTFGADAGNKTARLYFGATTVEMNSLTPAPVSSTFKFECWVSRTGAATQEALGFGQVGSVLQDTTRTTPAADTTATITVKVTGQNGLMTQTANTIVCEHLSVEYV